METHLEQQLGMTLSKNGNKKLAIINKKFFNKSLVMFDKEMIFFVK